MKKISSEHLFHYTRSFDNLKSIINDSSFWSSFCLEEINYLDWSSINPDSIKEFDLAYPMVCFTDLPTDRQKYHKLRYGNYSIVMKKSWGTKNHISPVIYSDKNYLTSDGLLKPLIKEILKIEQTSNDESQIQALKNILGYLIMHFKMYKGHFYNIDLNEFEKDETIFYDEREWRFMPMLDRLPMSLKRREFENSEIRKEKNNEIRDKTKLYFNWSDIEKIIVLTHKEKIEISKIISEKYTIDILVVKKKVFVQKT